jgi:hypothetical protein
MEEVQKPSSSAWYDVLARIGEMTYVLSGKSVKEGPERDHLGDLGVVERMMGMIILQRRYGVCGLD